MESHSTGTVRSILEALAAWAREETGKVGDRTGDTVSAGLRELGFVTQAEHEELELRVAQLEHRLRLLESAGAAVAAPAGDVVGVDERPLDSDGANVG